jgi:hypothetical protein
MRRVSCLLIFATSFLAGCFAQGKAPQHSEQDNFISVWKGGSVYQAPISDPRKWAAEQFLDRPNASVEEARLTEFELDIDFDGIPELFVGSFTTFGNAGGAYLVFRIRGSMFYYIGCLGLHPKAIRALPPGPDGSPRLVLYWRDNCCKGTLYTLKNDGKKFVILSRKVIYPGDGGTEEGRKEYKELFGY